MGTKRRNEKVRKMELISSKKMFHPGSFLVKREGKFSNIVYSKTGAAIETYVNF